MLPCLYVQSHCVSIFISRIIRKLLQIGHFQELNLLKMVESIKVSPLV